MSTAARIEELRKKFDENPRRYFAPLANELRKAGELTQAIALCREHLPKQPGHMSGYIVFGQALYESGDLDEARVVFEQALALDPENLIALHHLGHIAKQQGDTGAARRWYERALETDPRNDDIAHQLATLVTPVRAQTAVPTPSDPQAAIAAAPSGSGEAMEPPRASHQEPHAPAHDAAREQAEEAADDEPLDLALDELPIGDPTDGAEASDHSAGELPAEVEAVAEAEVAVPTGPLADDPFAFDDDVSAEAALDAPAPIDLEAAFEEGLVTTWPDTTDFTARAVTPRDATPIDVPPEAAEAFGREPQDEIRAALPEPEPDVFGSEADLEVPTIEPAVIDAEKSESSMADSSEIESLHIESLEIDVSTIDSSVVESPSSGFSVNDTMEAPVERPVPPAESVVAETSFSDVHPGDVHPSEPQSLFTDEEDTGESESSDVPETPAFVTETMGELLVAQGFIDRAVAVYEELVRRRPYDPVLSARLAELQAQLEASVPVALYTARERYAALAARRVARRLARPTPARTPVAASVASQDSLVELFGSEPTGQDDVAARSFADAFAPLPMAELPASPFDPRAFGGRDTPHGTPREPTPAYGALRYPTPAAQTPVTPRPVAAPPAAPQGAVDPSADFSFDRFFPDPARIPGENPPGTPASTPVVMPPKTGDGTNEEPSPSDDLAQFSAWLKGLGNS